MGTTPASPEEPTPSSVDVSLTPHAEAIATNIPCGNCPDGMLLIRDDGYVYCPACDHERPPHRTQPSHSAAAAAPEVAAKPTPPRHAAVLGGRHGLGHAD